MIAGFFLLTFAIYALSGPGYSISGDGSFMLLSARNLIRTGSTSVPPIPGTELTRRRGVDGREYPIFGPGLVLAHVPMLLAVGRLEPLGPTVDGRPVGSLDRDAFYAPFTNAWLMAATLSAMALCGIALGFGARSSVALTSLTAIASPLWLYARIDSTEALQSASLIGAAYFLFRDRKEVSVESTFAAGALLSVAVATKLLNLIVVPWFLLFAVWKASGAVRRPLVGLAVPLLIALALLAVFNQARFGSPFRTGYELVPGAFDHPLLDGAWVQVFSRGHGLVVFWPAVVLLPLSGREFIRRFPAESVLIAGVFVTYLAVYSKWWAYWGMSWGPRFLVPALPLLALALLPLTERGWLARIALLAALLVGFPVQGIAVASSYWGQVVPVWQRIALDDREAEASVADLRRWDELVHLTSVSPLRVGLWWLENAVCRDPNGPARQLTQTPWSAEHPWRDPERDTVALAQLPGLDLWAVPECWRRSHTSLWSKQPVPIPSHQRLVWLLLAVAAVGAGLLISGWRRTS